MLNNSIYSFLVLLTVVCNVKPYNIVIKSSGSALLGSRINFTAELYQDGKIAPNNKYYYTWSDNANPQHNKVFEINQPYSNFSVVYSKSEYKAGHYEMRIKVERDFIYIPIEIAYNSISYQVTELLTGNLSLVQNGTERADYVSIFSPLNHTVSLQKSDLDFLNANATYITSYWFRNCVYMGQQIGLSYYDLYDKENEEYDIEVLVVASFEKLPDPTTTTTTTTTTPATTTTTTTKATTSGPTTTSLPTSSIIPPTAAGTISYNSINSSSGSPIEMQGSRRKRNVKNNTSADNIAKQLIPSEKEIPLKEEIDVKQQGNSTWNISEIVTSSTPASTLISANINDNFQNFPYICLNTSVVAPDPKKVYGYFHRKVIAKIPVANLTITGNSWLQHGDILQLHVKCTGSHPLDYCIILIEGPYNITGNETCVRWQSLESCEFSLRHYFISATTQTVVIIVSNPVGKITNQIAVNFYKATKQSQLSVIVVPVSFSLVAVIIVVFGVAYYIQNRNRFIIEVADFNFGETQSVDMEHKTFQERLVDSIREVFPWLKRDLSSGTMEPNDDSSIKYGSMT